jgi:D-alanine-D-alanine ligase
MQKIRVKVLMGGGGAEHDVSIMSGNEVIRNLDKNKYKIVTENPDIIFIALHGKYGEDGQIQKEFEDNGIKFTGSGSKACMLGMDKIAFKKFAKNLGAMVPRDVLEVPCVVKPNKGGSSYGITIVKDKNDLKEAIEFAKKYDEKVIIEEYIEGVEVSCGVIGEGRSLPVIEICPKNGFFDYESKYVIGKCEEIVPARISEKIAKDIQNISSLIFKEMRCRGFARLDFIIKNNIPYLLEINMIPGLTPNSLLPKEAQAVGISFEELLDEIIKDAF